MTVTWIVANEFFIPCSRTLLRPDEPGPDVSGACTISVCPAGAEGLSEEEPGGPDEEVI